jgi:rare lipoprotein A
VGVAAPEGRTGVRVYGPFVTFVLVAVFFGLGAYMGEQKGRAMLADDLADRAVQIAALDTDIAALTERVAYQQDLLTFIGITSHYGIREHGKPTSLGVPFDKNALTAASKFLPYGSAWLVTNLENGKQVAIRISDDGPNVKGRYLDLSEAAAVRLDMKRKGLAWTMIRPVPRPSIED